MSCWPLTITNTMAAASMFAKLSDKLTSFVCGVSLSTANDDGYTTLSPSPAELPRPRRRSWSSSSHVSAAAPDDDDEEEDSVRAMSPQRVGLFLAEEPTMAEATTAPCLAFPSQHGYRVVPLAGERAPPDVRLRPVLGRRLVPSPYGGTVLAADVCWRHPCHLADPFTGERAPLPDLPVPRSEAEPVPCSPDEPHRPRWGAVAAATDDGLAWDWSPRGVMVARGDTAFFRAHGGGGGEWRPVHQSRRGSPMTVNHRGGRFFLLELRRLRTTVIDAATLRVCAELPPPPGAAEGDVDAAYLAPSAADALMLVHRAGDHRGTVFTELYRARHRGGRRPPRWARVEDIGDRAVFIDGAHGFTVRAGPNVLRNRAYVMLSYQVPGGRAAAAYDVGVVDLRRPEIQRRMRLDAGEVERAWGWQPYWIIPKDGPDRRSEEDDRRPEEDDHRREEDDRRREEDE